MQLRYALHSNDTSAVIRFQPHPGTDPPPHLLRKQTAALHALAALLRAAAPATAASAAAELVADGAARDLRVMGAL